MNKIIYTEEEIEVFKKNLLKIEEQYFEMLEFLETGEIDLKQETPSKEWMTKEQFDNYIKEKRYIRIVASGAGYIGVRRMDGVSKREYKSWYEGDEDYDF